MIKYATAILKDKRIYNNEGKRYYVVDLHCPKCQLIVSVALAGWSAIQCCYCKTMLEKPKKIGAKNAKN